MGRLKGAKLSPGPRLLQRKDRDGGLAVAVAEVCVDAVMSPRAWGEREQRWKRHLPFCPDQSVGRCAGEEEQAKRRGSPANPVSPRTSFFPASKALGFHPENGCGALTLFL